MTGHSTAHPHSRGENPSAQADGSVLSGSSPLTRGKRRTRVGDPPPLGLIPTHAGKTRGYPHRHPVAWAHPHSRGENTLIRADDKTFKGSSPLTRGKRLRGWLGLRGRRLIPTHAGKTLFSGSPGCERGAHPHSRGENTCRRKTAARSRGSSPLTRGKPQEVNVGAASPRLIPTHAGKTPSLPSRTSPHRAHPHSRGENP